MTKDELATQAFQFIKDRSQFFNKSEVEKECGIARTAMARAISRNQEAFKDAEKLIPFLDKYFPGWNN